MCETACLLHAMMSSFFLLFVASALYSIGCLGMQYDGTVILQGSMEHLINYTAYEALEYLNLKNLGSNVADTAYQSYKNKLSEYIDI